MPDYSSTYETLCNHVRQTATLSSVGDVLGWDEQTGMPTAAGAHRAEQLALLAELVHDREVAPEIGEWLAELTDSPLAADRHSDTGTVIAQLARSYARKTKLPKTLVAELTRAASLGQQAWIEARKANDFAQFAPYLERMMELKRQEADAVGYTECRYDALLDEYEPHTTSAMVGPVLKSLGEALVPIVDRIQGSSHQPNAKILDADFPVDVQAKFGNTTATAMGYDFAAGHLGEAAHPFCATLGPRDVRITTRYNPRDLRPGLLSILHETGHGLYEQGLPAEQFGLPTGSAVSLGIHESQSRMWEILVGLSHPFWEHFYPAAQQAFPALGNVALDDFHFAINQSQPSLIRVDADEATYNLHILIRYELESALINDSLAIADLPDAWNAKYERYLGITPPTNAQGVMQDVHWSCGLVGYFPTYSLGNLYAAQFFEQARADLGDLDAQLRRGEFAPLLDWLRTNIHCHGQRYTAGELAERVTGRPLESGPLLRHLEGKFGKLYRL